ncbi:hypothetical protein P8C59_001617 [Phyllachora maydis]|uniref:Mediator of RNA polymerase II transcription subunit 19 n=1 Tax=Phyllachora maydis TaxID=1825666 RepID=A0AAD9HYT7_9PEZI|nr:hypothetical protein P8C59_001617 [Phyllachora maydis]
MSFHPQTPQSPSQYSPSTTDPSASLTTSMTSVTTALPTPAHSINGSSIPSEMAGVEGAAAEDVSLKRKRALEDVGEEREQKKVQIEDRRLGIENLHLDVGSKYLLCRTPHMTAAVDPGEDLFERFGLTSLAAEYARVLPNGEKNALRKTYKGHIKKLGYPQEEWYVQQVRNREVENGFSRDTLSKLDKAMAMGKGIVPKTLWDFSVLGDLGPGKFDKPRDASARPTAPNTPMATAASLPRPKQQQSLAQEAIRPKRSVKKRSYGDSSYEGYGEGFPDDDAQGSGYAPGDGDLGSAGQKRRKKNPTGQQYPQARQPSYGPGMVGA